jgi:hypothetical protein
MTSVMVAGMQWTSAQRQLTDCQMISEDCRLYPKLKPRVRGRHLHESAPGVENVFEGKASDFLNQRYNETMIKRNTTSLIDKTNSTDPKEFDTGDHLKTSVVDI